MQSLIQIITKNCLQLLHLPSLTVSISLYFFDIQTPRQRHWHCEKSLTKTASFLSTSDSLERGRKTFYSRPENTGGQRLCLYRGNVVEGSEQRSDD